MKIRTIFDLIHEIEAKPYKKKNSMSRKDVRNRKRGWKHCMKNKGKKKKNKFFKSSYISSKFLNKIKLNKEELLFSRKEIDDIISKNKIFISEKKIPTLYKYIYEVCNFK